MSGILLYIFEIGESGNETYFLCSGVNPASVFIMRRSGRAGCGGQR